MTGLPDLPTAARDAARWELEFTLEPGPNAAHCAMAFNTLACVQLGQRLPDAAVASFIRAAEILAHRTDKDEGELGIVLMNATSALIEQRDFERALTFATRAIEHARHPGESATHLAFALMERAHILRKLQRSEEELHDRLEAMAFLAHPDFADDVAQIFANNARRIEELVGQDGS